MFVRCVHTEMKCAERVRESERITTKQRSVSSFSLFFLLSDAVVNVAVLDDHYVLPLLRSTNEIKNLQYLPRASEPREMLFEDRTRAHADHIGQGFERQTTAAVGVLKAVRCGEG